MSINQTLDSLGMTSAINELVEAPSLSVAPALSSRAHMPETPWHQLVVIGNGFDLECGLASRFFDFMESRIPQLKAKDYRYATWKLLLEGSKLTVWDFILRDNGSAYWYDIEAAIARWVKGFTLNRSKRGFVSKMLPGKIASFPFEPIDTVTFEGSSRPEDEQTDLEFCLGNIARVFLVRNKIERGVAVGDSDLIFF